MNTDKILKALGRIYCFIKREHDYNFVRDWCRGAPHTEFLFNKCMICGNEQLLDVYMYDIRVPVLQESGDVT